MPEHLNGDLTKTQGDHQGCASIRKAVAIVSGSAPGQSASSHEQLLRRLKKNGPALLMVQARYGLFHHARHIFVALRRLGHIGSPDQPIISET
jgi:hypothetical protein